MTAEIRLVMVANRENALPGADSSHPAIVEVRGKGLWAGVELDPARAKQRVSLTMLRRGVLTKETHNTVIRFAPPLVIDEADLVKAIEVFFDALEELSTGAMEAFDDHSCWQTID